ncbi:hypothetical protein PAECIP111890_04375 [Paenibacillus sp. JJ-223]|nr:hypothetical protein PAECIP111890_04375 [Paenibacillus sp. JJ-223]
MLKDVNGYFEMVIAGAVVLAFLLGGLFSWVLVVRTIYFKITKQFSKTRSCDTCGKRISSSALICPSCGQHYPEGATSPSALIVGGVFGGVMFSYAGLKGIEIFIEEFLNK